LAALLFTTPPAAQWLNYPSHEIRRTPDGKANLSAPAPKTADGKPDISGLWQPVPKYIGNIASDLKPAEVPLPPWSEAVYKHRRETESKDDPTGWCVPGAVPRSDVVPYPFKILSVDTRRNGFYSLEEPSFQLAFYSRRGGEDTIDVACAI
jgi:hypothetical protein